MLSPTLNSVACPPKDGDPGSSRTKFHRRATENRPQSLAVSVRIDPTRCCRLGVELPAFCPLVGVASGAGVGEVGVGGAGAEALATVICSGCCLDISFESKTETVKLKRPLAAGVPEIVPVLLPRSAPPGSRPDMTPNWWLEQYLRCQAQMRMNMR